jgi:hypothetical protein
MGVVCCEAHPKPAHDDVETNRQQDPSSLLSPIAGTTATASVVSLPSDHESNHSHRIMALNSSSSMDQTNDGTASIKTNETTKASQDKKKVRINDEVTLIPLLTSASFFRKTPKPTTITSSGGYGIMPSFRIVTPAAIPSESSTDSDDDEFVSKASLWWTKQERREILQANQKASRDFKRFQPTKIRQANLVYHEIVKDCCCRSDCEHDEEHYDDNDIYEFYQRQRSLNSRSNANAVTSSTSATTSTRSSSSSSHSPTKKRKHAELTPSITMGDFDLQPPTIPDATLDLPTNVRGLEWGVIPDAKRYRKAHARTVLRWQDRFRKMNNRRRRHDCEQPDEFQDNEVSSEWSLPSSSSSFDDDDDDETDVDGDHKNCETTRDQQHQEQVLLLGQKASISSLRSCLLARVFGKSDEVAANPAIATASDLEEKRSSSWSPTPSWTGTSESSGSEEDDDDSSESDDDESDSESDGENDDSKSDGEDDEDGTVNSFKSLANRSGYHSTSVSTNPPNTHKRMFRPRMMPPSWR